MANDHPRHDYPMKDPATAKAKGRPKGAKGKGKAPLDDPNATFIPSGREANRIEHLRASQSTQAALQRTQSVQKKPRKASKGVAKASKESASMQEDAPAWAKQLFDSQAKRMGKLKKQLAALKTTGVRLMPIELSSRNESNSKVGDEGDDLVTPRDANLGLDLGLDEDYVFDNISNYSEPEPASKKRRITLSASLQPRGVDNEGDPHDPFADSPAESTRGKKRRGRAEKPPPASLSQPPKRRGLGQPLGSGKATGKSRSGGLDDAAQALMQEVAWCLAAPALPLQRCSTTTCPMFI
jgi:hypothetical protein